ncbi:BACON domain-containing carbohydrate-binding protein [Bacteroides sp. AN502(2024)]|uniref:BACON domain-containing protein n=1 Tax=Bacteroides sp. AN502(2024) TaxID=3160599 RepID=UPI0035142626
MDFLKNIMITLLAATLLWGCSDDDESIDGGETAISLSTYTIQADKNGGDITVTVTSSGDWRLAGVCDWAHPSVTSGKDGDVVTFTIDPNTLDEKRTATFKFFTGSAVAPLQVEVLPGYMIDLLSDDHLSISREENAIQIRLNTNVAEPVITYSEGGEEWLAFDRRSDFGGKVTLSFKAAKNETYKERSATITISSPLVTNPVNVSVNQKRTEAIIPETDVLMYDLSARTISFKVRYNVEYTASIVQGDEWMTAQSVSQPQVGDDGLTTVTLTYTLSGATDTRGGLVWITNTDNTLISEVVVVQKDPDAELVNIPDQKLRELVVKNNWALSIAGSQCIILEAGRNATTLSNSSYYSQLTDLTGIENFPNLTSLNLGYCTNMKKLDISGLHKVESLSVSSVGYCEEYNLGDNPIRSFNAGGVYGYLSVESLKFSSSKLESLDLSLISWYASYDNVTSIDVSECPMLTTLNANRSGKVKTLYLKKGQDIPNLIKNDATTIVYK